MNHESVYALYKNVAYIEDTTPYDIDGNVVEIDMAAVEAKYTEMKAARNIQEKAVADAKQSAIDKLAKIGLTENEVKALLG